MSEALTLPLAGAALAVTVLSALPALTATYAQFRSQRPKDRFYEDADGVATPKALAEFSNRGIKTAILLFSAIGQGTTIASLIISSISKDGFDGGLPVILQAVAWGLILIHAICIALQHSPVKSHNLGLWLGLSSFALAFSSLPRLTVTARYIYGHNDPSGFLWSLGSISAIALGLASFMLPRRPAVFLGDYEVDRQWTVSALNRFTWTWVEPLLRHASVHNDVGVGEVPQADSRLRSHDLKKEWDKFDQSSSLFRSLFKAYKSRLALLWTVTLIRCSVSILPFWSMLRVLNILEDRPSGSSHAELFALIMSMALSNLLDSWLEGWGYWYSLSGLALPIRTQISGLVFDKALRRKNVKVASKEESDSELGTDANLSDSKEEDQESSDDGRALKSQQGIVNLVGIDTERISYFLQYHFLIITGVVKLFIFSAFLLRLLGWIPFVAGIIAWGLTLPANTLFSNMVLTQSRSLMKVRDTKLSKINEVLLGMRQIKFSALESQWEKRILALREAELKTLWGFFLADSGLFACWVISPILLAVASLTAYVLIHGSLLPSIAFVSIGIFNTLETTLGSLPELLTLGLDSLVSLNRISLYLEEPERQRILTNGPIISFQNATISWPGDDLTRAEERFTLRDLNLTFPHGELSVISGKTGTGKTLLISAILGEAELLRGEICVPKAQKHEHHDTQGNSWTIPDSIAYISQTPWLENTSLRNNILFGLPFVKTRYEEVIQVCALEDDLAVLPDGDATELGANGVNLSGGQKWRVTLARAVYSRAGILVMEDIFSAVDAHVGAWIFEKCLTGQICKDRTRILVTHHLGLVSQRAKFVVELDQGKAVHSGPPQLFVDLHQHQAEHDEPVDDAHASADPEDVLAENEIKARNAASIKPSAESPRKFMQDEERQKGTVKGSVYLTYVKSSGGLHLWAACISIYLAYQAGVIGRAWWLRMWTGQGNNPLNQSYSIYNSLVSTHQLLVQSSIQVSSKSDLLFYLKVYVGISIGAAVIGILRYISAYFLAVRASRTIFQKMLFAVMHVPLRWIDTVPTGRILNRFTADFNIIDERITLTWSLFFTNLLRLVGICIASCFASIYLVPPAIVLLGLGVLTGARYLVASRPLKRLESNAKSPVFELFNTTLAGITTIRAFQKTHTYLNQMQKCLDAWVMTTFYIALANRWMSFRMALIAALFSIAVGVVIIVNPIDAALAGLALSFILDFSESLRWTIRCYGDMELEMNSMERVVEYMSLETEPLTGEAPPAAWPTSGAIEVENLEVAYAPDLPPVLKGVSLKVQHNERIGVVGRTGAGKSSLTLALFRFLDTRSGSIKIDGIDISKIPLNDLRSRLSIIPQDPVLFSGTVRSNLDPFGDYADDELFRSLARVQLINYPDARNADQNTTTSLNNSFLDLSSPISESGGNLSQGQRQLLCIARALLANSKIIVLDEATSAVDVNTDTLIQRSIREGFTDRTLIVIAHRLNTISDFDKILVLDNGKMVEFGTPRELWEKKGTFRSMCDSTGESEREKLRSSILD